MGDFKDKTGKTRVGKFLQTLGEKAVPLAEMALNVAAKATGIDHLEELADKIGKSPDLTDFEKNRALQLLDMDLAEMEQVSERWKSDMVSDSWLSKNVRPLVMIYLIVSSTIILILDSMQQNYFVVKDVWVSLLSNLLVTVIVAYFSSRGVEKFKKMSK